MREGTAEHMGAKPKETLRRETGGERATLAFRELPGAVLVLSALVKNHKIISNLPSQELTALY